MVARRPHGLVYGLLAASLAVNLIGAGYFGYHGFQKRPPKNVENTIEFVSGRYPGKVGEAVRERLVARRGELQSALDELKEARRGTRRAMREEPLDKARVEKAFSTVRAKGERFQSVVHGAIVDAIGTVAGADRGGIDGEDPD